ETADDAMLFEVGRRGESGFGGQIFNDQGTGGAEGVPAERAAIGGDECPADTSVPPSFACAQHQVAMLRLQLEDVTELDVEAAGDERRGGVEELGARDSGQRLLAEMGDRFLLAGRRAQLLLGAARFLDARPPKPFRSQPSRSVPRGNES